MSLFQRTASKANAFAANRIRCNGILTGWMDTPGELSIVCKNIPPIIDELKRLRQAGIRVMAVVSDLESSARSAYLGIDNRAAGNVAAYLMGRHLEERPGAQVAVVVGSFSYRCHEDREIGFRSTMRQQFKASKSWRSSKATTPTKPPMMPPENCCK